MRKAHAAGLVLAVHTTARGFGWVLFENAESPVDWGIASAKAGRDARLIARFERLLKRYEPAVLVLEAFEGRGTRRVERVQNLCQTLIHLARCKEMRTPIYGRDVVSAALGLSEGASRHDITQAVAARIEAFRHRVPAKRKLWTAEDARQSLFDAAALALTYFTVMGLA